MSNDTTLTLSWSCANASSVDISPLGSGLPASGSQVVPTQDQVITLVARADSGAQSAPYTIEIHTHEPEHVVSPIIDLGSGVAEVLDYGASVAGVAVTQAAPGDVLDLRISVTDGAEGAQINGAAVALTRQPDDSQSGAVQLTVSAAMSGALSFSALKNGAAADTKTLQLEIAAARSPLELELSFEPTEQAQGEKATLRWTVSDNAVSAEITGLGVVEKSGEREVEAQGLPGSAMTYTLRAKDGEGNEEQKSASLQVLEPKLEAAEVELTFTDANGNTSDSETTVSQGSPARLAWAAVSGAPASFKLNDAPSSSPITIEYDPAIGTSGTTSVTYKVDAFDASGRLLDRKIGTVNHDSGTTAGLGTNFKVSYDTTKHLVDNFALQSADTHYCDLDLDIVLKGGGEFAADGVVTNENDLSMTEGLKTSGIIVLGITQFAPGPLTTAIKGTAGPEEASILVQFTWNVEPGTILRDVLFSLTFSAFKFITEQGKKSLRAAVVTLKAGGEWIYPPDGSPETVTIKGINGKLNLQGETSIAGVVKPNLGGIAKLLAEKYGFTLLSEVLELGGATLFIELLIWGKVAEVIWDWISDELEVAGLDAKLKKATKAFASYYVGGLLVGDSGGAIGGDSDFKQASKEGEAAGNAARGPMLQKFRGQPLVQEKIQAALDDGKTEAEIDKAVNDAFDDKIHQQEAVIEGRVYTMHLGMVQTSTWLNYVARQGTGYNDHARTLFSMWFLGGASLQSKFGNAADNKDHITKAQWFGINANVRKQFLALPGNWVLDPYPDGNSKTVVGPPATQATVDKVWRWMQDHPQASAADYRDYDPGEVHLNSDQVGQLNQKMAGQNSQ